MAKARILSVGYVTTATLDKYDLNEHYDLISAKDNNVEPDGSLLESGVDIGLMTLHIADAPERRKFLGLLEDRNYEIMVSFSPVHLHTVHEIQGGISLKDVIKAKYARFFNIDKEDSAGGFTYKKMFVKLIPKGSLSIDVELTEIDNKLVDPNALESLLEDTGIGTALDLSPVNTKDYIMLASNVVHKVQEVFGSDKAGDDPLWNDTLVLEAKPTIPGSYRLKEGFYAIAEDTSQTDFSKLSYSNNRLLNKETKKELDKNYLVFSIGKSI